MMGRTAGLNVQIALDDGRRVFHPGDHMSGTVHVSLKDDMALGTISVRLFGRSKSKIVRSNGQSVSISRGRVDFFSIEKIVQSDKFTRKSGDYIYPFEFDVPECDQARHFTTRWKVAEGFLNTANNSDPKQLPPSMSFRESKSASAFKALVAYGLDVEIVPPQTSHAAHLKPTRSTKYLILVPRSPRDGIDPEDPSLRRGLATRIDIRTFRLLPQHAHQPTLKQKILSSLHSSQVPRFSFDLDISYNSVLEVHRDARLPFIIAAIPNTDPESTTIQPTMMSFYRYPNIMVRQFHLSLEVVTQCRCPMLLSDMYACTTRDVKLASRSFEDLRLGVRSTALDQKDGREDSSPTSIDLGQECDISTGINSLDMHPAQNTSTKQKTASVTSTIDVVPSFISYNISRKYFLVWTLDLECSGEKLSIKGRSAEEITVVGPPLSTYIDEDGLWPHPPPDFEDSDDEEQTSRSPNGESLPAYTALPDGESAVTISAPATNRKTRQS